MRLARHWVAPLLQGTRTGIWSHFLILANANTQMIAKSLDCAAGQPINQTRNKSPGAQEGMSGQAGACVCVCVSTNSSGSLPVSVSTAIVVR